MASSLLPRHHEEFNSRRYWDQFFLERGNVAFEWYGNYRDVQPLIERSAMKSESFLIIGCGNSDFSFDFYDAGYHTITNLDFSTIVIDEMKSKNGARNMHWNVGDMTKMPEYKDNSIDVIFDKGALDALMSTNNTDTIRQAKAMFSEIDRILSSNGKYICITLGETYIFTCLMQEFHREMAGRWNIFISTIQSSKRSPFKPFFIAISRSTGDMTRSKIEISVDRFGNELLTPSPLNYNEVVALVPAIQDYHRKQYDIGEVRLGRFENFDFYDNSNHKEIPRFTIAVVDAASTATRLCAVFFIPPGRESEYQFSSQDGLTTIAMQAGCKRLLAVRCNRPHVFPPMTQLQTELSPIVLSLKPVSDPSCDELIPYMALEQENDWDIIDEGNSTMSGAYYVEEGPASQKDNCVMRRLVFLQNQNFIQTEIRMKLSKKSIGGSKKGKGKKSGNGRALASDLEFDYSYLDDHHRSVLISCLLAPHIIINAAKVTTNLNEKKQVMRELERSVNSLRIGASLCEERPMVGLIIGLGGGAMPMVLQRYLPGLKLYVCELDGEMESVATKHFGFKCNSKCSVIVSEGMHLIHSLANNLSNVSESTTLDSMVPITERLDFLFIDVDSKDPSLGMSAPPQSFVTSEALSSMYKVLRPGGMLVLNVAARVKSLLLDLAQVLKSVW